MRIFKQVVMALTMTAISTMAHAVPFSNGDFTSGGTDWNDASSTGSVSFVSGAAQLDTGSGDDPYSAILVQGDDGAFNFGAPISLEAGDTFLNFDVSFISLGTDVTETGGSSFGDYLSVVLYDSVDSSFDTTLTSAIDSSLGEGFVRYNLDVSSLIGRDIALSFELSDLNDGFNSRLLLDNISFSSVPLPGGDTTPVPEPDTLFLLGLGFILLGVRAKIIQS